MQHEEQTLRHGGLQKDILEREKEREQSGKKSWKERLKLEYFPL